MPEEPPITPEEENYFRSIEERFCALRGAPLLLSPRDWALIGEWWSQGIPLSLVLESLEEVFAARARRGDPCADIHSLAYTRHEVQRRWNLRRELISPRRGEGEGVTRLCEAIRRHLGRVARGVKEAGTSARLGGREELAVTLLGVAADLRAIRKAAANPAWDPAQSGSELDRLDSEVLSAAGKALDDRERVRIGEEVEAILAPHRQAMKIEVLLQTRCAVEGRLIRRYFGIPRISLLSDV